MYVLVARQSLFFRPVVALWEKSRAPFMNVHLLTFCCCIRCGPTVYAPSHMGHARTYLSFDILRRILQEYFGYQVCLIMNVTDLDDKIIERSREQGVHHLELSQQYEQEFHEDMQSLGIQPPTIVTRVTDYMEEIINYIQVIVDKGLAYGSHGSVYFDVQAFEQQPDMHYCKLAPEQIHNAALLAEGEGKLTQDFVSQKRSPRDFALWKSSKPGEPEWPSQWGPGRPGWHIECSVMASDVLQQLAGVNKMDMHSGGVDLKFPHHDNEMAQAEAHSGCQQWVNYFVHSGHLHIHGFKMSKSLKNFITIRQALEEHTARQIRFLFLLHKYNLPMDYGDNTMSHALVTEKLFTEFFHNVKAVIRQQQQQQATNDNKTQQQQYQFPKWNAAAYQLQGFLQDSQDKLDAALKDDFDTATAMQVLVDLIKATNSYLQQESGSPVVLVVSNIARYITRILQIFGIITVNHDQIGFGDGGDAAVSREQILAPVLDALVNFRSQVRDLARVQDARGVLGACDQFRDDVLPDLGVRLEDITGTNNSTGGTTSIWKLADPQELQRERQQRQLEIQRKQEEKEKAESERLQKEAMNRLSPAEYMKVITMEDETTKQTVVKYSQFDSTTGMPTHMNDGEPLNKNQTKKAQKEFQGQEKKYEKYLAQQQKQQEGSSATSETK